MLRIAKEENESIPNSLPTFNSKLEDFEGANTPIKVHLPAILNKELTDYINATKITGSSESRSEVIKNALWNYLFLAKYDWISRIYILHPHHPQFTNEDAKKWTAGTFVKFLAGKKESPPVSYALIGVLLRVNGDAVTVRLITPLPRFTNLLPKNHSDDQRIDISVKGRLCIPLFEPDPQYMPTDIPYGPFILPPPELNQNHWTYEVQVNEILDIEIQ